MASNTTILANALVTGRSAREGSMHTLLLGASSNAFNLNSLLTETNARDYGRIYFYTNTGSLKLRAANGTGRSALLIAAASGNGYAAPNQFVDLGNHYADLLLSTLRVGQNSRGTTAVCSNYFGFANGVLDTTELRIGNRPSAPASAGLWQNVCSLGGGSVVVGSAGITMGYSLGSNGASATNSAVLNISGGFVTVSNDIVMLTQMSTTGNNTAIGTLNITGGTNTVYGHILCGIGAGSPATHIATLALNGPAALLDLKGRSIGGTNNNAVNYLDVLNFQAGTLQNVAQINGGADLIKTGAGTLTLSGTNAYTGRTVVSNGTLLVNGMVGTNALTVTAGTLGGAGVIRGSVTVQAAGTLAPGISGIATLSITNKLTLQGTNVMEIARNGSVRTNDAVAGLDTVTYGGRIIVTNVGTSPLQAGDSFKLFSASSYTGVITNLMLPGGGYTWTNRLLLDGTVAVLTTPHVSPPTFYGPVLAGTNLVLRGTNGTPNGTYYLLASTNVALSLANWTVLSTNTFDSAGAFSNNVPLSPAAPRSFFVIRQ